MKIVGISDFNVVGSGYNTLAIPIFSGLAELGYDVKICGLGYRGQEHPYDFSLIPCTNYMEVDRVLNALIPEWKPDVVIQAMDIPVQLGCLERWQNRPFKFFGIFPLEADPLNFSSAMSLMQLDKCFVISEFGTKECKKAGLDVEWLEVGIDTESWRPPTLEEKKALRRGLGFDEDTFVVLTVADNQERKNLVRSMEIFADFNKKYPNSKYLMVTRENLSVGWKLRDYAQVLGINQDFQIFERGLSFIDLWSMYARADAFLLTSKAEGLGLPLLEAMAVGIPCVASNCTAITELLEDGRGLLIDYLDDPDLSYIDPFGNQARYFAKRSHGVELLCKLKEEGFDTSKALEFVRNKDWNKAISQIDKALKKYEDSSNS